MKYIIEHMEKDLSQWSYIEYQNISKIVGKANLIITNTKNSKLNTRRISKGKFLCAQKPKVLDKLGTIKTQSVTELKLKNACLLDPSAKKTLTPKDTKKFKYLIFGGILGDYPRKKRTKPLADKLNIPTRNIGKKQMSTDNAVLTTFIITNNTPFKKIKFKDKLIIQIAKGEEVILPYRYVLINGKPFISNKIIDYLKKNPL